MIETYKLFYKYDQDVVPDLDQMSGPTRGHSKKLFIPRSITDKRRNSFYVRMRKPWNSLNEDLINAPSVYSFENGLDKLWKAEPIKFKYDAFPPGHDPANLKRRMNLELNIEA